MYFIFFLLQDRLEESNRKKIRLNISNLFAEMYGAAFKFM